MKLLLTSAGITNAAIKEALFEMIGRDFGKARLAFIPTAANVEEGDKDWLIDDLWNFKKLGFAQIDIVDISAVSRDIWEKRLAVADVLVFGGGNTFYLNHWIAESGLKDLLPEMLKTKIYVGISAGSIVTAGSLNLSDSKKLYEENVAGFEDGEGLGFVEFHIRPHFKSPYFPELTKKNLAEVSKKVSEPVYALDDSSAIKVIDGEISVVSEGEWERFN